MSFPVPKIVDNPTGWGPTVGAVPEQYADMPFAPFSKEGKLGRAANFTQRFGGAGAGAGAASRYPTQPQTEEDHFQLIDNSTTSKPTTYSSRGRGKVQGRMWQTRQPQAAMRGSTWGGRGPGSLVKGRDRDRRTRKGARPNGAWGGFKRWDDWKGIPERDWSINVDEEWEKLETLEFKDLSSLTSRIEAENSSEVLETAGFVHVYDRAFDRITPRTEKKLEKMDPASVVCSVSASDDPILNRLSEEKAGNVFCTIDALVAIMASPRSLHGWDVVLVRRGDNLWIDVRGSSNLGLLTVNETAKPPPTNADKDSVNSAHRLSVESTSINRALMQQVIAKSVLSGDQDKVDMAQPHPFMEEEAPSKIAAPTAYVYKKFALSDAMQIVVRCDVHAVAKKPDGTGAAAAAAAQFVSVHTLTEYDPKLTGDWRQKLLRQAGSVFATEYRDNKDKMTKWAMEAILTDVAFVKLAYVTRVTPRDANNHSIIQFLQYKPREFARQVQLDMTKGWAIIERIAGMALGYGEGKYLLVKDPNAEELLVHRLPDDFTDEENDDSDEDEDEDAAAAVDARASAAVASEVLGF